MHQFHHSSVLLGVGHPNFKVLDFQQFVTKILIHPEVQQDGKSLDFSESLAPLGSLYVRSYVAKSVFLHIVVLLDSFEDFQKFALCLLLPKACHHLSILPLDSSMDQIRPKNA